MIAPWPEADQSHCDPAIEEQFKLFQTVLSAVREIRSRQNIPPKEEVKFYIRCDNDAVQKLQPLAENFESLALSRLELMGPTVEPPQPNANATFPGLEIYVDLAGFIDVEAEIARQEKEKAKTEGLIAAKEKKLSNASFVDRAPPEIVQRERDGLQELRELLASIEETLAKLKESC